jgi:hypothetical protein
MIGLTGDYISVPETEEIQMDAMELSTLVCSCSLRVRVGRYSLAYLPSIRSSPLPFPHVLPYSHMQRCTHASDITTVVSCGHLLVHLFLILWSHFVFCCGLVFLCFGKCVQRWYCRWRSDLPCHGVVTSWEMPPYFF